MKALEEIYNIINEKYDAKSLDQWLKESTDFFTAPASVKYHNAFKGGLIEHCLNVANFALNMRDALELDIPRADVALAAFLHDLGKAYKGYYVWNEINNKFICGTESKTPHAHLSVFMLNRWNNSISFNVQQAILLHNGLYTGTGAEVFCEQKHSVLDELIHDADMLAVKVIENK